MLSKEKKIKPKNPTCSQSFYLSEKINVKHLNPATPLLQLRVVQILNCLQTPLEKALLITELFAMYRFSHAIMNIKVTFSIVRYSAFLLTTDRRISCQKNTSSCACWQTVFHFLLACIGNIDPSLSLTYLNPFHFLSVICSLFSSPLSTL